MGNLQVGNTTHGDDIHDATVVEIELEDTVRPVTAIEVTAVEGNVVELVIHLWDRELLNELTILVVLPELTQLDGRGGIVILTIEGDRLLQVAGGVP